MSLDRREFLKLTGQAGLLLGAPSLLEAHEAPAIIASRPHIVVIGAGAFGGWTALYLRQQGANVTVVDAYGPGNSRSTSGDETRGIRSSYADNELWVQWAREAISRWRKLEEEWKRQLFFTTGDLIMRADPNDTFITQNQASWNKFKIPFETLTPDEIRKRWPQIRVDEMIIGLFEPDAGVARARRTCEVVAEMFTRKGGRVQVAHAQLGAAEGRRLLNVRLTPGDALSADTFVFACGPWLGKVFPELLSNRIRTPLGHVFYYGSPPGDQRFTYPNIPSWNIPGVTGWPGLNVDNRGFRVRTSGRPPSDPDTSVRWIDYRFHEQARRVLRERFPGLEDAPLLETRACHYESSPNRNFLVDKHPDYDNVWLAGAGNAEGFKMGPVIGEYIAKRVLEKQTDPALATAFAIPQETYDMTTPDPLRAQRFGIGDEEELLLH